jgi:hypothetical protein
MRKENDISLLPPSPLVSSITYGSTRHTSIQIATLVNLHRVITRPAPYAGTATGLWLVLIPLIAAELQEDHQ